MRSVLRDTLIVVPSVRLVRPHVRDRPVVAASTCSVCRSWFLASSAITVILCGQLHALVEERLQVDLLDGSWRFSFVVVRVQSCFLRK